MSNSPDVPVILAEPARAAAGLHGEGVDWSLAQALAGSEWMTGVCALALDLGVWCAVFYSFGTLRGFVGGEPDGFSAAACAVQIVVIVLCLYIVGGYDRQTRFLSLNYISEHCITLISAAILGGLVLYVAHAMGQIGIITSSVLVGSQIAFAPLSLIVRRRLRVVADAYVGKSFFLVLGREETAKHLHRANTHGNLRQVFRFVEPALAGPNGGTHSLDPADPAAPQVETLTFGAFAGLLPQSSGVIVAEDFHKLSPLLLEWLSRLHYESIPVYTVETFYNRYWRKVPVWAIDAMWPLELEAHLAQSSVYTHAKRLMDVVLAGAALLVLAPVLGLIVLLILLESGRPALFRQTRVGRNRRPFIVYKFRSMYNRPTGSEGSLYTGTHDPRITPLGRWLRKLRLDELPQLWNVLRGDMSLIGPRAEWDQLVGKYEPTIPFYHFRHLVKPGITGWAQVNYPYGASEADAVQKLKYDLYYIRHYSLRLDAMIVFKTLHTMLWGKGQ